MSTQSGGEDLELPIAVRRQRRSCVGLGALNTSQIAGASISPAGGIETPLITPLRKEKRVRFSAPGPSMLSNGLSIGLTPATGRASKRSKAKVPNRRHSAPVSSWNLEFSGSSTSGIQQFAPLRQVLDGRVKRMLRRNHLSEEMNNIEYEKKTREKSRLAELAKLRSELQKKDNEMQTMRDEWNLRNQVGDGVANSQDSELNDKVRDLESHISALQTELNRREASPMHDETDWTLAARDPFHDYNDDHDDHDDDDDDHIPQYDNDFDNTTNMNDIITSTPTRREFLSPPSTLQNTPNMSSGSFHNISSHATSTQADLDDPEKERLEKQVAVLQSDLNRLLTALKKTTEHHGQLTSKLSQFMPSEDHASEASKLNTALDTLLTHLANSQTSHNKTKATLDTLRAEIGKLGFSPTSSAEQILAMIALQFRQARLDLEYMTPGEIPDGFENQTLLRLLVERIRVLLEQLKERDADADQHREQERALQQQLDAQIGSMDVVQQDLANAKTEIQDLNSELSWQASSNEKLKKALEGYRLEVKGLEDLVGRMETDHSGAEAQLKRDLESAVRRAEGLEAEVESYEAEKHVSRAVTERRELLLEEFKNKLNFALQTIESLKAEMKKLVEKHRAAIDQLHDDRLRETDALMLLAQQRGDEMQEDYLADVAAAQRVEEMSEKFNGLRQALGAAHATIETLEHQKAELEARIRDERGRANGVVMVMREQLKNALKVGMGFLESEDDLSHVSAERSESGKLLGGESARRRGSGDVSAMAAPGVKNGKAKKRRYDSGLGFLEEDDEEHGNWVGVGDESLAM